MERDLIEPLVEAGLTQREVADKLDVSCSTVRHWAKKYNLVFDRARKDNKKYSKEFLEEAVKNSTTFADVLRYCGRKGSGGNISHVKRRIESLDIDYSHFTGQASNRGKISPAKKSPSEILVVLPEGSIRAKVHQLRRALLESGIKHECELCGIGTEWNFKPLVLEVDHLNRNWLDNRIENLRFLCPNCHSQQ